MESFFVAQGVLESPLRCQPQVLAIGNFDGVHLGHRALLSEALSLSQRWRVPAVVLTFHPHPLAILNPPHYRLFDLADQQDQFRRLGLRGVVYLPFTRDFSQMRAQEFLDRILASEFCPKALVVGYNFRFGAGREGSAEMLRSWGESNQIQVTVVPPFSINEMKVSTTEIRRSLAEADVQRAQLLLGRPYVVSGLVVAGQARGRQLGYPTANLHLLDRYTPAFAVYATRAHVRGKVFDSISHFGPLPTFHEAAVRLETHLFDFSGSLYGQFIEVEFVQKIRDVIQFAGKQELMLQIESDVQVARKILAGSK